MDNASGKPSVARASRLDGRATRLQILEKAGELFAEQGLANTTSKQICEHSQANSAAVNYHFVNKEGLYRAVLLEAHARFLQMQTLVSLSEQPGSPQDKLRALITLLVERIHNHPDGWALKVLTRELLSPSPEFEAVLREQSFPKAHILRSLLGQIMNLPADHPTTLRSAISVFAPCLFLLIAHQPLTRHVLQGLSIEPQGLIEHMVSYALGGLQAVADTAHEAPNE
ncbi:TetR/AcrR family transcriptional regulator [Pseudomonas fluorescens]|uniref:2,4-diacetylphloroglucinol biosynthesis protein n=1 Tax=Pseudomonas fluorescens TaxID=294 RepID=A0A0D0PJY6_PSEFL|nr:TetR/AcrR family transcriptional regulator [Pseudomonas fluorescens]KIQ60837.1 2,4-diacetylphloroglucinol biosynthesis protein [Pseudomonas fluorescens]